jgi:NAD(P)H-nitrite reductase large subunit
VLLKFVLMLKRQWVLPYKHDEICHCRLVPTEKVTQAIEQGAHSTAAVARVTMAGTGCGTCRTDTEMLLDFYNFK